MKWAVIEGALGTVGARRSANQPGLGVGRSLKESFLEEVLPKVTFGRGLEVSQAGVRE